MLENLKKLQLLHFLGDFVTLGSENKINLSKGGFIVNGIPSSINFLITEKTGLGTLLYSINDDGNGDKIVAVFTVPKLAVSQLMNSNNRIGYAPTLTDPVYALQFKGISDSTQIYNQDPLTLDTISRPSTLDGYTPKNKKLLTYPYCYLGFNPLNATQKIYRFENFPSGQANFLAYCEVNPNPTVLIVPQDYRGNGGNSMNETVSITGYPQLSTTSDYFNTWLAQNSNIVSLNMNQEQYNYEVNALKGGVNMASQLFSPLLGGGTDGIISGTVNNALDLQANDVNHEYYIKQQIAQIERQSLLPDSVSMSSSNATSIGYELNDRDVFCTYTIKAQFAKIIDEYFDMYGYQTNRVKVPNLNNRPNWNYVKTINANIVSSIPQEDLTILKNIFNQGVTIWHNPNTFLDYSQNNR